MSVQNKGKAYGTGTKGTVVFKKPDGTALIGTILHNHQSQTLRTNGEFNRIKDPLCTTGAILVSDPFIEADFTYFPEGSSLANALASSDVPGTGWHAEVSAMDIIEAGPFTDAFNTDGANTQDWIVLNASENRTNQGDPHSITVTMQRFPGITSGVSLS